MKHKRNYHSIKENIYELLRRQRDKQLCEDYPRLSDPLPNQTGGAQSDKAAGRGCEHPVLLLTHQASPTGPSRVKGSSWLLLQLLQLGLTCRHRRCCQVCRTGTETLSGTQPVLSIFFCQEQKGGRRGGISEALCWQGKDAGDCACVRRGAQVSQPEL